MKSVILIFGGFFMAQSAMAINLDCTDTTKCFPVRDKIVSAPITEEESNITLGWKDPAFYSAFSEYIENKFSGAEPFIRKTALISETNWDGVDVNTYLSCGAIRGWYTCDIGAASNVIYDPAALLPAYSVYLHLQGNKTGDSYANGFINILSEAFKNPSDELGFRVESFSNEEGTKYWLKTGVVGGNGPDSVECFETSDSSKNYCKIFIWTAVSEGHTISSVF